MVQNLCVVLCAGCTAERLAKCWQTFLMTLNPCIYFAVNLLKIKTENKLNILESLFFSHGKRWRTRISYLRLSSRSATAALIRHSNTVHRDSSERTEFTVFTASADLQGQCYMHFNTGHQHRFRLAEDPRSPFCLYSPHLVCWSGHTRDCQTNWGKGFLL